MSKVFVLRDVQLTSGDATFVEVNRMAWCPGNPFTLVVRRLPGDVSARAVCS
jgi:hypothetical protein